MSKDCRRAAGRVKQGAPESQTRYLVAAAVEPATVSEVHRPTFRSAQQGFTLIEIIVASTLMAIIAGIIVAGLTNIGTSARKLGSEPVLAAAHAAARAVAATEGSYPSNLVDRMEVTGVTLTTGASTGDTVISVYRVDDDNIGMAVHNADGSCLLVVDSLALDTEPTSAVIDREVNAGSCRGDEAVNSEIIIRASDGTMEEPEVRDVLAP